jgi:hypothetical protein
VSRHLLSVSRHLLIVALVLCVALIPARVGADDAENIKKARADVLDVVKDLQAGKDVAKKVDAIRKKYEDMEHLMVIYKPRDLGGLGIGPVSPKADGIEYKILNVGMRGLTAAALAKEKAELIKVVWLNVAMARISRTYTPRARAREWNAYCDDMEKASKRLLEALKKDDPVAVKKAAWEVHLSCAGCHTPYTDR